MSGSMPAICEDRKRERTRVFTGLLSCYLFVDRFGRPGKGDAKGRGETLVKHGPMSVPNPDRPV